MSEVVGAINLVGSGGGGGGGTVTNTGDLTSGKAILGNGGVDVVASNLTLTNPATTATITIANNKTFTVSNTLTLTGTDGSSVDFGGGGTVLYAAGGYLKADGSVPLTANWNAGAFTLISTQSAGTAATIYEGFKAVNSTAAAAGAQQYSPSFVREGRGWATGSGGSSQSVRFRDYVMTIQGTTNPSGIMVVGSSINGAAYSAGLMMHSAGGMAIGYSGSAPVTVTPISLAIGGGWDTCTYNFLTSVANFGVKLQLPPGVVGDPALVFGTNWRAAIYANDGSGTSMIAFSAGSAEAMRLFNSRSLSIGSTSETTSAILSLTSTTRGFLPPVMTGAQRDAISSPASGLQVKISDGTFGMYYYDGNATAWVQM